MAGCCGEEADSLGPGTSWGGGQIAGSQETSVLISVTIS